MTDESRNPHSRGKPFWLTRLAIVNVLVSSLVLALVRLLLDSSLLFDQTLTIAVLVAFCQLLIEVNVSKNELKTKARLPQSLSKISDTILIALIGSTCLSLVLLNIDRSRSFYVLYCVKQELIGVSESGQLVSTKNRESLPPSIELRLEENETRRLLTRKGNKLELSSTGNVVLFSSEALARLFNLQGWHETRRVILESEKCINL